MKKITLACAALLYLSFSAAYGQFSEKGYKGLKLGSSIVEAKKIANFKPDEDGNATIKYDGIEIGLYFMEDWENPDDPDKRILWGIFSGSPTAKIQGINAPLIGKSLKEVKTLLGDKFKPFTSDGPSDKYFIYYKDAAAEENYYTSCMLSFNEKGILESINAMHNP